MSESSPLQTDRGTTIIETPVVSQVAGIAAQEVQGVQMGGSGSRAVGGLLESVTGGPGGGQQSTRGVVVEVGDEEAAVDLDMAVEYGNSVPQISEAVRRNVINRIENLVGLRVTEVNITVNDVLFQDEGSQPERQEEVEE
ncbi:MAG: Asp23/Gls24 family envelope stress response protein [Rubrobacteraceae bacterium]